MLLKPDLVDSFTEWAERVEPSLRHALTASFGSQAGADAAGSLPGWLSGNFRIWIDNMGAAR